MLVFAMTLAVAKRKSKNADKSYHSNVWFHLKGTLSTADPDNEGSTRQYFTYLILGNTAGLPFILDGSALNTTRSLNYETQSSWSLTIQSTDNGKPSKNVTNTFTISVMGKLCYKLNQSVNSIQ
jgi:hypothetical protein